MTGSAWEPELPLEPPAEPGLPLLPYAGTSGWSGSDTSRERAVAEDSNGTTTDRQRRVLGYLRNAGLEGLTWKELAEYMHWHHGSASGVLSVLHKEGHIARLATQRRHRCAVYVLPEYVQGRATAAQGRSKPDAAPGPLALTDAERKALQGLRQQIDNGYTALPVFYVRQLVELVERHVD